MLSAIASVIDVGDYEGDEEKYEEKVQAVIDTIPDPAGTFYRFSMAHSLLKRARIDKGNGKGETE